MRYAGELRDDQDCQIHCTNGECGTHPKDDELFAEEEKSICIGYNNCVAATNFPPALKEKINRLKWYFAHASVGANMMDGITDLNGLDKNLYPFRSVTTEKTPPANPQRWRRRLR